MSDGARFAYVQSRLQARHGRRLTEADWRMLEATEDLAGYLQAARQTFFRDWIHHLAVGADTHDIERSLRQDWDTYCGEVAGWLPPCWRPAVSWFATIVYLPAVTHLARSGPAWRWMSADAALEDVAIQDPESRRQALAGSRYRELAGAISAGAEPLSAWLSVWDDTMAGRPADARARRAELGALLQRHFASNFERAAETPAGRRRHLQQALTRRFRSWAGGIGAVFTHLGLVALDAERLRAGLVMRALIPHSAGRPAWA